MVLANALSQAEPMHHDELMCAQFIWMLEGHCCCWHPPGMILANALVQQRTYDLHLEHGKSPYLMVSLYALSS